ncbi:hypothetical protein WR25_23832 [Diploscapter pachys]|uniref:Uncharacterized protein n=1 Tax=Diploscapter pachys TaxID=2018661 RepID=A0A2A2J824_9BILA|nr:hypothetical protein WR25_23832 [Diploscapter pachys]
MYLLLTPYLKAVFSFSVAHAFFALISSLAIVGTPFWSRLLLLLSDSPKRRRLDSLFTLVELVQMVVLIVVSVFPNHWVRLSYPCILLGVMVFRELILPKLLNQEALDALDAQRN